MTRITAYAVPAGEDERFLAAWRGAPGTLHRALRPDVDFRFVEVAPEAANAGTVPFEAHGGSYAVVREDGAPDAQGGVVLINLLEVPERAGDGFLAGWDAARAVLARQRGYLGTRLHRSTGPSDFRFVNVACWSSPLMFARALQQPELAQAAAAMPFPAHLALYQHTQ